MSYKRFNTENFGFLITRVGEKSVSRSGALLTMRERWQNAKLSIGDVGCEPCEFGRKQMSNRRNTHRSQVSRCKKLLPAFSLVEMLMALLVASLILAALAPVITKRMKEITYKDNVFVSDGKAVYNSPGEYIFIVPDNVYELKIQASGGGGGGGGANLTSFTKEFTANKVFEPTTNVDVSGYVSYRNQKGWYAIDFTVIGPGGSGGFGYIKNDSTSPASKCETLDPSFKRIPGVADSGRDLCYFNNTYNGTDYGAWGSNMKWHYIPSGSPYYGVLSNTTNVGCYTGVTSQEDETTTVTAIGSKEALTRMVCTPRSATALCFEYVNNIDIARKKGVTQEFNPRLMTRTEMQRIVNASPGPTYKYLTPEYLDMTQHSWADKNNIDFVSKTYSTENCPFLGSNDSSCCGSCVIVADGGHFAWMGYNGPNQLPTYSSDLVAGEAKCVYEIMDRYLYTGGGGAGGIIARGTLKVANDGWINITVKNPLGPLKPGESRVAWVISGSNFKYHKESSGTFVSGVKTVEGRFGNNADIGGNAAILDYDALLQNLYGSSDVSEACEVIQDGVNITKNNPYIVNLTCNYILPGDINGKKATDTKGGAGSGGATGGLAGADEAEDAKGANATKPGFGGGGGACYSKARNPNECSEGGLGGPGQVTFTYKLGAAGSGGGAGGAVGNNDYVKIKVEPKDVVSIKVGKGGFGGGVSANGYDGEDTIITIRKNGTDKKLVFKGGKGGVAGTFKITSMPVPTNVDIVSRGVDKDSLLMARVSDGGENGSYPDISANSTDNIYTKIINPLTSGTSDLLKRGGKASNDTNGYEGGEGGTSPLGNRGGCGGFEVSSDGYCNSSTENGADATPYSPTANQGGGAGGGGGGFNSETENPGMGGNGAGGYVFIRWEIMTKDS